VADIVQVMKQEWSDLGGDSADESRFPQPIEPQEDQIECAGVALNDASNRDATTVIARNADDMTFKDGNNATPVTLTDLLASGSGITEPEHEALDTLTHNIAETSYDEIIRTGARVSQIITWDSVAKTTKIREEQITRTLGLPSQADDIQYDASGVEDSRVTEVYGRTGGLITSITRTKS
jgi:hypothetical protein